MSSDGVFHFHPLPGAIRAAQIVGITSSAILSGYIGGFSLVTVPSIASAPPSLKSKQWEKAYDIGAATSPYIALLPTLSFAFLATQAARLPKSLHDTPLDPRPSFALYTAAAVLVPAIVPWTLLVMKPTNDKIHAKANGLAEEVKEDQELDELLPKWQILNYLRALLSGTAAVVGCWAVVARPEFVGLSLIEGWMPIGMEATHIMGK